MKLYVLEEVIQNMDGDLTTVIRTFQSKPHRWSYVIWV